jgi:hypothetical protein
MFAFAGVCIVLKKKTRRVSLLAGGVLLLIFCFYFIPYQFMSDARYTHFLQWENAEKELAFCSGAFVIAGCFPEKNENLFYRFLGKLIPFGPVMFGIPIICFGLIHVIYAKDVADYVPSWVPARLFWAYFCGAALLASGLAIILKMRPGTAAALLGTMIFIWFMVLHVPKIIVSPAAYLGSEVTSALIALAYSGIAFVIAGATHKKSRRQSNT